MVNAPSTKIWTGRHWNGWNVWNVPCVNFSEAILNFGVLLDALLMLGKTCVVGVHEWKAQLEEVCHVQSQLILRLEVPKKTHFWCADEVDDMLNKMGCEWHVQQYVGCFEEGYLWRRLEESPCRTGRPFVGCCNFLQLVFDSRLTNRGDRLVDDPLWL